MFYLQGLPSTYLNPQDSAHGNDSTDIGSPFSSQSQQLPPLAMAPVASDTTLVSSSSLAESLTEFAGILGGEGRTDEWVGLGGKQEGSSEKWEGLGGDMYNPFDSNGEYWNEVTGMVIGDSFSV